MVKRLTLPFRRALAAASLAFAFAVLVLSAAGCGKATAETRTVRMTMRDYAFNGSNPTFAFKPGERIHFIVTNGESTNVLHNFRIAGMNVECGPPLKPGETRDVTVTMPASGEFVYTCCTHPGMGGKMVVTKK